MSYSTQVYIYNQRQVVVTLDGYSIRRYEPVYAKDLIVSKGVDNTLEFQFINQEQKPVDMSGKAISCRIISYDGNSVILQKALIPKFTITGIFTLALNANDLLDIDTQLCYYTLIVRDELALNQEPGAPVYTNASADIRGVIRIENGVLPRYIPTHAITFQLTANGLPNTMPGGGANNYANTSNLGPLTFTSSLFQGTEYTTLIQTTFANFTGNVQLFGSTNGVDSQFDSSSYKIGNVRTYTNQQSPDVWLTEGYHPFMRFVASNVLNGTIGTAYVR